MGSDAESIEQVGSVAEHEWIVNDAETIDQLSLNKTRSKVPVRPSPGAIHSHSDHRMRKLIEITFMGARISRRSRLRIDHSEREPPSM
jgi:hypothetical protein